MRCKKPTLVADCPMPSDKLYYLSVHTLDNMEGVKYGKSRVHRELLDMWLEKKFTYGGHGFNDQSVALTEEASRLHKSALFACHILQLPTGSSCDQINQNLSAFITFSFVRLRIVF